MRLVLCLVILLIASSAFAQNPTTISYGPSADHNTVVNGTAVLTRYDAVVKKAADGTVVTTKDCGKPASAPTLTCALPNGLPGNTSLTVTMVAVGPGGSTAGPASDPFANLASPAAPGKPTVQ